MNKHHKLRSNIKLGRTTIKVDETEIKDETN